MLPAPFRREELVALKLFGPKHIHLDTLHASCAVGVPLGSEEFFAGS